MNPETLTAFAPLIIEVLKYLGFILSAVLSNQLLVYIYRSYTEKRINKATARKLEAEGEAIRRASYADEIESLDKRISILTRENDRMRDRVSKLEDEKIEFMAIKKEYELLKVDHALLEREYKSLKQEHEELRKAYKVVVSRLTKLEARMKTKKDKTDDEMEPEGG